MSSVCRSLGVLLLTVSALLAEVSAVRLDLTDTESARSGYLALPFRIWGSGQYRPDPTQRITVISLSNSRGGYGLTLAGPESGDGRWLAGLGMPYPSKANWYTNSFFTFSCGAIKSTDCQVEILACQSGADRGVAQLRYRTEGFAARLEIMLLEDDDRLLLTLYPEQVPAGAENYRLDLLCYPGSYGGGFKEGEALRQREARTAQRTLSPSATIPLNPDESWICFYDNYFDVAQNRGEGPCAVLYNPAHVQRAETVVSNYACTLRLTYPSSQPAALMLWDCNGQGNRAVLDFMQALQVSD